MKLLLISINSFSKSANNGKTFESMLRGFKCEELAQLYFSAEVPDFEYCERYFRITDIDIINSLVKLKKRCGGVVAQSNNHICANTEKQKKMVQMARKFVSPAMRDLLWATRRWDTAELHSWCSEFAPDVVMCVGGPFGFLTKIAGEISNRLGVPLVTFYTDDYLLYSIKRNVWYGIEKWRRNIIFESAVKQSKLLLAIGELMAEEYSTRFNRKFHPIMNSVDITPYREYPRRDRLTISYFGGLHLNRWKMIVRLAELINQQAQIEVYTMNAPEQNIMTEFKRTGIHYCGGVTGEILKEKIYGSDILLHIESDNKYMRRLTSLSVSTKIPEYLVSGRPILGFGPAEVASMKLLADNNIGFFISSEDSDSKITEKLSRLINDFELRKKLGTNGYEYATLNFDNEKVVERLMSLFNNLL